MRNGAGRILWSGTDVLPKNSSQRGPLKDRHVRVLCLEKNQLRVTAVADGRAMWRALETGAFDLVVLDLMLHGDDGLTLCRNLRAKSDIPVLIRMEVQRPRWTALSHDLKTPLTRMRLRTELLDHEETRTPFESDLQEMEAMVAQTLDFIRGLGGHEARAPLDIDALLASLQSDIEDAPDRLVLHVLDTGPGIAETELESVFEPFHRLEFSRNRATGGTGLGLGIARSIARLHGGDVVLQNRASADGGGPGGLDAVLELPRPQASHGSVPGTRQVGS